MVAVVGDNRCAIRSSCDLFLEIKIDPDDLRTCLWRCVQRIAIGITGAINIHNSIAVQLECKNIGIHMRECTRAESQFMIQYYIELVIKYVSN